jgi:uncharacterized protein YlxW (UPF0749 family)
MLEPNNVFLLFLIVFSAVFTIIVCVMAIVYLAKKFLTDRVTNFFTNTVSDKHEKYCDDRNAKIVDSINDLEKVDKELNGRLSNVEQSLMDIRVELKGLHAILESINGYIGGVMREQNKEARRASGKLDQNQLTKPH